MYDQQLFTISNVHRSDGAVNNSPKCRPARIISMVKDYTNNREVELVGKDMKRKHENVEDEHEHVIIFFVFVAVAD
jgi:hypothetical protein